MKRKPATEFLNSIDPDTLELLDEIRPKCPDLIDSFLERLYGDIYQSDGLSLRERILVSIATTVACDNMESPLLTQTRLALKIGISREELLEVVRQVSVFCGYPKAINAAMLIDSAAEVTVAITEESACNQQLNSPNK